MEYARPILGTLAALYCLFLAVFALSRRGSSLLNRYFALFNLSIAWATLAEYTVFISNPVTALWYFRFTRLASCFMIPFFLRFVSEFLDLQRRKSYRGAMRVSDVCAGILALLHFTPFLYRGYNGGEIPGPLFFFFPGYLIFATGLLSLFFYRLLGIHAGLRRRQVIYLFLATAVGFIALIMYSLSYFFPRLPRTYYPLQALISFTFAYAIFKHNLIPARIALRRVLLAAGIYIAIAMILIPLTQFYYKQALLFGLPSIFHTTLYLSIVGAVFTGGPFLYSKLVNASTLFHEKRVSEITHEMKTPLSAIQSAQDIIEDELTKTVPDKNQIQDYMELIRKNTDRLDKVVSDVLEHVSAGQETSPRPFEQVDLSQLVGDVMDAFPEKGGRVVLGMQGSMTIMGVREGLKQVFMNLISNAIKFCPEGKIEVMMKRSAGQIDVYVQDQGMGINPDHLVKIFTPFFKGHPGVPRSSGLGLTIVKRWVEIHHGTVWADSSGLGKGATVGFSIPLGT